MHLMKTFLAIDAGGTSTRCALVTDNGHCLGYARTGSGNPVSAGHDASVTSITLAAQQALSDHDPHDVEALFIGMAGGGQARVEAMAQALRAMGIQATLHVEGDLLPTFCSGTLSPVGYALVAGTGATGIRVADGEVARSSDGLGWLLGDVGSGFWIGRKVARAVLADLEGRGPHTAMTRPFLGHLGLSMGDESAEGRAEVVDQAVSRLYAEAPVKLARFSRLACEATTDAVACEIVSEAITGLGTTLRTLFLPDVSGPIVLGGGLLSNNPGFVQRLSQIWERNPEEIHVVADGVVGACVLALRSTRIDVDDEVFARIRTTVSDRSAAA